MALAYWIAPALRLVVVRGSDVVTEDESVALREALARDTRLVSDFRELVDEREVTDVMMSQGAVHHIAALNPYGPGARRAVVAPRDLVYGMARMWQLARPESADELRIFRELAPALHWLDLAEADLPAGGPDYSVTAS